MRYPGITTVAAILKFAPLSSTMLPDGRWVPSRPMGFTSWRSRLKAAWLVFTGRADALIWDGQ